MLARFGFEEGNSAAGGHSLVDSVHSKAGIPIRLTDERWAHISDGHRELAGMRAGVLDALAHPQRVYAGKAVSCWR